MIALMKRHGTLLSALLATVIGAAPALGQPLANPNYNPPPAKEGYSYPDCYCTDSQGKRVELGETACLQIGSKQVLARCEMSVNNPTWRHKKGGCPGV